jgi:Domain of unknown function (DUF4956)
MPSATDTSEETAELPEQQEGAAIEPPQVGDASEQVAKAPHKPAFWGSMRATHLFYKLTIYYTAITTVVVAAVAIFPWLDAYLPIGGAQSLLSNSSSDPFSSIEINASRISSLGDSLFWLTVAVTGAVLTILPVSWTYMAVRKRSEYDQSLVETIMVLPIAVTSIVVLVHNSLALAFSLAGIFGVVRFRNSLKSTGDALYILIALAIGLSAGVGAMEVAIVMSLSFNYCFLILWVTDYGARKGTHRYMRKAWRPDNEEEEPETNAE